MDKARELIEAVVSGEDPYDVVKDVSERGDSSLGDPIAGKFNIVAKPPGNKKYISTTLAGQPTLNAAKKVCDMYHKKDKDVHYGVMPTGKSNLVYSTEG